MNTTLNTAEMLSGMVGVTDVTPSKLLALQGQNFLIGQDLSFLALLSSEMEEQENVLVGEELDLELDLELDSELLDPEEVLPEEFLAGFIPPGSVIIQSSVENINGFEHGSRLDQKVNLDHQKQSAVLSESNLPEIALPEIDMTEKELAKVNMPEINATDMVEKTSGVGPAEDGLVEVKQTELKQDESRQVDPIQQEDQGQIKQAEMTQMKAPEPFLAFKSEKPELESVIKDAESLENILPFGNLTETGNVNPAEPEPAEKLQVHQQIAKEIELHSSNNTTQGEIKEFSMDLYPKELGKINVKFKLDQGKISIDIASAKPETHKLLTGQIDKLVGRLGLSNLVVENVQLVQSKEFANVISENQNLHYEDQAQKEAGQGHKQNHQQGKFKNKKYAEYVGPQIESNSIDKIESGFHKMNYTI